MGDHQSDNSPGLGPDKEDAFRATGSGYGTGGPIQDDFDLEGLSPEEARAYVARFITAKNQVSRDRQSAEDELALWKKRTGLATERGEIELAKESLARAEEVHARLVRLKREEHDLDFKVTELKRRLTVLRQRPEVTVNADALLERLESVVGTDHETRDEIAEAEAEVALEALKKKMESESDE